MTEKFLEIKTSYKKSLEQLNEEYDEMLLELEKNILKLLEVTGIDTSEAVWGNGTSIIGERNSLVRNWYSEISNHGLTFYQELLDCDYDEYPTETQFNLLRAWDKVTQALQYGLGR